MSRATRYRLLYLGLAAPGFLLLAIVFAFPLVDLMRLSVENGSLAHYREVFSGGLYIGVFWDTVEIAALVTVLCAVLGYPVAHFLANAPRGWALFGLLCVVLPFWWPTMRHLAEPMRPKPVTMAGSSPKRRSPCSSQKSLQMKAR